MKQAVVLLSAKTIYEVSDKEFQLFKKEVTSGARL